MHQNEVLWNIAVHGIGCLGGQGWIGRRGDLAFPCKFNVGCCVLLPPSASASLLPFRVCLHQFCVTRVQEQLLPGCILSASHWDFWCSLGAERKQGCREVLRCRAEPESMKTAADASSAGMTRITHTSSLGACQETCSQ